MAWKIEKWLTDVFPGSVSIYEEYRHLTRRELAIVAAGVLDLGLAQLLSMRLAGSDREREEFLGLNGDGRAPAGSFGARIQLGVLTGTITSDDADILRIIKNIRNCFAHRVRVDFTSPDILPLTSKLCERWGERTMWLAIPSISTDAVTAGMDKIKKHLSTEPEAGAGLLLSVFSTYQAYFHRLSDRITPVEDVVRKRTE
uniref:Uncharacterized protein n=1 Tax=Geobacter sp. (strain M21) TaxID=443144 RepID=C6E2D1_GEOSM